MDTPVNVPVDDPNADTEWNDILRKHGVIPEKPPSPTPQIEEALLEARRLAHENRLEGKDLDELDELEDEEDEMFLNQYRQKRLAELSSIKSSAIYNQVYHLQKPEYAKEVTEISQKSWVLVLLTSSSGTNEESKLLIEIWRELAQQFGDIKFCQMQANLCIEGYPDRNTPTVLIYKDGDIKKQIVTLRELQGARTTLRDIITLLISIGALQQNDSRVQRRNTANEDPEARRGIKQSASATDEDDSDWE